MKTNTDITTPIGFYETYFELLKFHKTKKEAFNFLNATVKHITGHKPYKNFETFKSWHRKTHSDIMTPHGFLETYLELIKSPKTRENAFNSLNATVEHITGHKPYENYEAFALTSLNVYLTLQ